MLRRFAKSLACLTVMRGREKCMKPHARVHSRASGTEEQTGPHAAVLPSFQSSRKNVRKERIVRLGDILTYLTKPAVWTPPVLLVGVMALGGCFAFDRG